MSLWDELPAGARNSGELDSLKPLLDGLNGSDQGEETDADGTWHDYLATLDLHGPVSLDPATGSFNHAAGNTGTPIEFPDPTTSVTLGLHLTGPGGTRDGGWRVTLAAPSVLVRLPFLRGAFLDAQGELRADANHPDVRFTLPALRVRVQQLAGGSVGTKLLSASTGGPPVDQIYEFVRMDPPYALIGPSEVVGFAFRTAVLDLSGTAGPSGVPPTARAMPVDWQGFYLPEARLFVAPTGVEGLAVSAGVRDMWIGIGVHAGVTGILEAEVVNRGGTPTISARFQTATGEWIADPDVGTAQVPEHSTLYVDGAGGIAPVSFSITVDGVTTASDRVAITTPAAGTVAITVAVRDGAGNPTSRSFTAARRSAAVSGGTGATGATVTPGQSGNHRIVLESQTTTTATVRLEPRTAANWTWSGGSANAAETAEVPVAAGGDVLVTATLPASAPDHLDCYFLFDHPKVYEGTAYADNRGNTHAGPAATRDNPGSSPVFWQSASDRRATIGANTVIKVDGYASWEGSPDSPQTKRNLDLSQRRIDAAVQVLKDAGYLNVVAGTPQGETNARNGTRLAADEPAPPPDSSSWWLARGTTPGPSTPEVCTANVRRPTVPAPQTVDPRPHEPGRPDCFRKIGVRVELVRGTIIRAEIYGEFDIETAAESALAKSGEPALRSGPRNPSDGICDFLLRLRIAEDRNSWNITAEFRAAEADLDGLAMMDSAHSNQTALDVLGAVTVLAPLTSATTNLSPAAGALVALGTIALGASDLIHTRKLILRGGELFISDGIVGADGTTTVTDRGTQVSVLLDLEVEFTFDLGIVKVNPAHPVTTRYKAVGVRSKWGGTGSGGGLDYVPLPVFDPSRGYSLDIPTGSLMASPPLDDILRVLGMKVSKDNPTYLEVEVGMGLDLGILKVDTVRVRGRLDGPPLDLQLTKLGATLDIPGTIHGSGYIEITPLGFKGAFDLTIVPVNVRGTAVLAVESSGGVTGVLVGLEVEFPVALPLGNSGLGLLGLMGGVGANYARNENPNAQVPALEWLMQQFTRTGGVMDPDGWTLTPGHYAFAAGALIGTVEGGYVLHLKGIIIIEVPGPRLLLVMKADVLSAPPVLNSNQSATFLAVLDIDFGRGTITIGIVAAYEIQRLLKVRVPVTAFFDSQQPENWLVELGNYQARVTVDVLDVISGSGYLMVHGNGITIPGLPPISHGLAIAVGFHIQAVLMGSRAVGLYLEVAAGFDAILGFDPFFLGGKIYVSGELRIFIVSIGASAELTVLVGKRMVAGHEEQQPYVHGEVCGEVDFFFFSVKGCVSLTIGSEPDKTPVPLDLVAGVSLISRTPARLEGTGTEGSIDGKLADALSVEHPQPGQTVPDVQLDAVPVVVFRTAPDTSATTVMGADKHDDAGAGANPWTRIGDRWWKYQLVSVDLAGALTPPSGAVPSAWWKGPDPADPAHGPALALLDWLPTPFSAAVPYGKALTDQVDHRWGTVCDPAAPPAEVLWTFDHKPVGPSQPGWHLDGVPWPDPANVLRTAPVEGELTVTEPWRCDPLVDIVQGTQPASVIGDAVPCFTRGDMGPNNPLEGWLAGQPLTFSHAALPSDGAIFDEVVDLLAAGVPLGDVAAARAERSWDPGLGGLLDAQLQLGCDGRILRSPAMDVPEPAPLGTPEDRELVKESWARLGFTPDPLADAIKLHANGGLDSFTMLLLVPERLFAERLVLRFQDAKGGVLGETRVSFPDLVNAANPLPAGWVDPSGPWADPVQRAGRIAARVVATSGVAQMLALVSRREVPRGTVDVVVGWDRAAFKDQPAPPFYFIAMSGLVASERYRHAYDDTVATSNQKALSNALTEPPDNRALLVPGTTYTVSVVWKAEAREQDLRPGAGDSGIASGPFTQSYQFAADGVDKSPKDLAPWLLATEPGMDDVGVFCTEPIRIALATQKVADLFAAYGKELRVVVRAASGKHPEPPGGGLPGQAVIIPIGIGGVVSKADGMGVMTPWRQAVGELVQDRLPCIDSSGESTSTTTWTLPYTFEPLTDYLIDIHSVPSGAPADAVGLVHRIGFTTSRFASVDDLASFIFAAYVQHRVVITPAPLQNPVTLPDKPSGDQLDSAFQQAGLSAPETPDFPEVHVLWSSDATPQPVAVVVECSEPLWRSRLVPTVIQAPSDSPDPTHTWWAGRPADWLALADSTTPPAGEDLPRATVDRIVHGPGSTRAVVLLAAGSRGKEVRLDLVIAADALAVTPETRATAVRVSLIKAPWEMEA